MAKKMLDDICEKILSETKKNKWMSLQKLREILRGYFQEEAAAEQVMSFLGKYLIEVDNDRRLVRLNDWAYKLYENIQDCL